MTKFYKRNAEVNAHTVQSELEVSTLHVIDQIGMLDTDVNMYNFSRNCSVHKAISTKKLASEASKFNEEIHWTKWDVRNLLNPAQVTIVAQYSTAASVNTSKAKTPICRGKCEACKKFHQCFNEDGTVNWDGRANCSFFSKEYGLFKEAQYIEPYMKDNGNPYNKKMTLGAEFVGDNNKLPSQVKKVAKAWFDKLGADADITVIMVYPDITDEHIDEYGNPAGRTKSGDIYSETIAHADEYTMGDIFPSEFLNRYGDITPSAGEAKWRRIANIWANALGFTFSAPIYPTPQVDGYDAYFVNKKQRANTDENASNQYRPKGRASYLYNTACAPVEELLQFKEFYTAMVKSDIPMGEFLDADYELCPHCGRPHKVSTPKLDINPDWIGFEENGLIDNIDYKEFKEAYKDTFIKDDIGFRDDIYDFIEDMEDGNYINFLDELDIDYDEDEIKFKGKRYIEDEETHCPYCD